MNRNLVTEWDPNRIRDRIPCVLGAVGSRRCGKSTSVAHLVYQMFDVFDLVICFVGSAACSPTLEAMMESHPKWDTRMFFSSWNQPLIDKLQERGPLGRFGTVSALLQHLGHRWRFLGESVG